MITYFVYFCEFNYIRNVILEYSIYFGLVLTQKYKLIIISVVGICVALICTIESGLLLRNILDIL